ncbi:MAG: hypothetical protein ABF904_14005, partial [Ethanoligenens sp.]
KPTACGGKSSIFHDGSTGNFASSYRIIGEAGLPLDSSPVWGSIQACCGLGADAPTDIRDTADRWFRQLRTAARRIRGIPPPRGLWTVSFPTWIMAIRPTTGWFEGANLSLIPLMQSF